MILTGSNYSADYSRLQHTPSVSISSSQVFLHLAALSFIVSTAHFDGGNANHVTVWQKVEIWQSSVESQITNSPEAQCNNFEQGVLSEYLANQAHRAQSYDINCRKSDLQVIANLTWVVWPWPAAYCRSPQMMILSLLLISLHTHQLNRGHHTAMEAGSNWCSGWRRRHIFLTIVRSQYSCCWHVSS